MNAVRLSPLEARVLVALSGVYPTDARQLARALELTPEVAAAVAGSLVAKGCAARELVSGSEQRSRRSAWRSLAAYRCRACKVRFTDAARAARHSDELGAGHELEAVLDG